MGFTSHPYRGRGDKQFAAEDPRVARAVSDIIKLGVLDKIATPAVEIFDEDTFHEHCDAVMGASFPPGTLHATRKAQPTAKILRAAQRKGLGCETASYPELMHALRCGFSPATIIFDSPSKTRREIKAALDAGVWLNADNFSELIIIDEIVSTGDYSEIRCGIRVNIQTFNVSSDVSSITSTSTSKFGVGLRDDPDAIVAAYAKYPWMNAIHVHCGSQGVDIDFLVNGASLIVDLVERINSGARSGQITHVDIGGGLETDYIGNATPGRFEVYAAKLRAKCPQLWSGKYRVATEFGRALSAKVSLQCPESNM